MSPMFSKNEPHEPNINQKQADWAKNKQKRADRTECIAKTR